MQSRVCLTVSIFRSARACGGQALARTPWQGATQHTDDLAGSLGLSCVRGASLEQTLVEDSPLATSMPATPATEVQPQDHRNALDSNVLQKTPALAMAEAQTCHRSRKCTKVASEPNYPCAYCQEVNRVFALTHHLFLWKSLRSTIPYPGIASGRITSESIITLAFP